MMKPEEITRLEYKRKFIIENLNDVKRGRARLDEFREKLRLLFFTFWFGTVGIYLKDDKITWMLSILLFLITAVFFYFEYIYEKASQIRLYRIGVMENWMMQATDSQILNLAGPLADVVPEVRNMRVSRPVSWQGRYDIMYIIFLIASILIKLLFSLPAVYLMTK